MRVFLLLISLLFLDLPGSISQTSAPNILLIVADDLGYADLGCYGGDIATPNIDALAGQGVRFSRFHSSPKCAPTRAMLLSGNDNHIAGMGRQGNVTEEWGYDGHLSDRIATIPQLLKKAGYHTYMAGKWHLGLNPEDNPRRKGFERSYAMLHGGADHYTDRGLFPGVDISQYTSDGRPVKWPVGAYSTTIYTDKIIDYIERDRPDGKPFFAYAAYTSPHWPLQVDEKYWRKYEGRYSEGYEALRSKRLESLKQAGMISQDATLPALHPDIRPWASLSDDEKLIEARKMELYSGMVDNLDENIGRLIDYLKTTGQYENTLVIFMSDNGAAHEDFYYHDFFSPHLRQYFNDDYDKMGEALSFVSYGPQWAEAGAAPFKYFKAHTTEGAMISPVIISGPGVDSAGLISDAFVTLTDIAPTIYEMAEVTYPGRYNEMDIEPLIGTSLSPILSGSEKYIHDDDYVWGLEHNQRSFIIRGDWKLVSDTYPFDPNAFALYNLKKDIGEQVDLKDKRSGKFKEMMAIWDEYVESKRVIFGPLPGDDN